MNWKDDKTLIARLASQPGFGLVTDVDGTISPIVNDPDQAYVLPRIAQTLEALVERLPLVGAISGRPVKDLMARVGVPGMVYIGNHGFERMEAGQVIVPDSVQPYQQAVRAAVKEIPSALLPGMVLEDKAVTLTIHYRNAHQPEAVKTHFKPLITGLADRLGLRLFEGRKVFELRPPVEVDKGTALAQVLKDFNVQAAIFLGDDTTDIAALKMVQLLRTQGKCQAYGVGVESTHTPAGVLEYRDYGASGVEDVADLLAFILISGKASST